MASGGTAQERATSASQALGSGRHAGLWAPEHRASAANRGQGVITELSAPEPTAPGDPPNASGL